ncbi:MAG TPA: hypothetical protein VK422_02950 [Pyrinomonadaceae bacterium]|nr:hypothetical protein [Pyrinomonadaceae bacterium]
MRRMQGTLSGLLAGIFALGLAAPARAQEGTEGVRVTLSLAGGKAVYRAGEPVRLVLSFTSEREGFAVNTTTTKPASPIDQLVVAPEAGLARWLDEYSGAHRYSPDYASVMQLKGKPVTVELVANDWFRFDRPGRYTARVKTFRALPAGRPPTLEGLIILTTNEVSFEVVAMSAEEEAQEVRRLSAAFAAAKDWREAARVSEELSYLTGEAATREKVRLYLMPREGPGNAHQNLYYGLYMARDRALVARLLHESLRDTKTPPTHSTLHTLTHLRMTQEGVESSGHGFNPAVPPETPGQRRQREILNEYLRELAASLPKRSGASLTGTAMLLLDNAQKDAGQDAQMLADVREILLREFERLHPYTQERLLSHYWEQVRGGPSMRAALEGILTARREPQSYQLRGAAIKRLIELDPERARPFVVAEIRDPSSAVDLDVLRSLKDETLPEADAALLEHIRRFGPGGDIVQMRHKGLLAARYASPAVYDGMLEAYQAWGSKWQADARAAVLGYLARWNEAQAMPLVERAAAEIGGGMDSSFFLDLTASHTPAPVLELVRKRLEGDDPQAAGSAAYVLSKRGTADDGRLIEARLERWLKEWGGRTAELDGADQKSTLQSMAQVNLMWAVLNGNAWKLPEGKARRLKERCVTRLCRQNFQIR